ncbi:amino acid ABC transporter substrate-binding protein [Planococcus lenghuensis]|uniref:Amino acid ABC transporter substrate-binding protein n=1 Tax=Planococcus lenghuensis TaxID=2213202 RepID=A0A1Q2KWK1_9BACL|nr:amino acid ABC transporter substrate-binding protein [Planococcus lenghuensis]AQQ52052.1 amino acid ABC transporter substrate-binding protein [Planococcus lenghuensis]
MKKSSILFVLLLGMILLLAACGAEEAGESAEGVAEEENLLTAIEEEGVLRVGTEGTYPPFTFHDESGELTGFDVEIAREVADRLGVEAEFMETQWDAMFAGLDAGRFDMVANQVGIREDRLEQYDFSDPYITSAAVLVTRADDTELTTFEDLEGKTTAQSLTSNFADIATSYGAEIEGVEGFSQSAELLVSGRVDALVNDRIAVLDYLQQRPDADIQIAAIHEDASQSGLMFREENEELVEAVNEALAAMIEDGTYEEISKKWFGENVLE